MIAKGGPERPEKPAEPRRTGSGTRESAWQGLPVLLLILLVVSVTMLSAATASIALAAPSVAPVPSAPMILPGSASASREGAPGGGGAGATADDLASARWIIGTVPGKRSSRIVRDHGASAVATGLGIYRVSRSAAGDLARRLDRAGLLAYAEPDVATTAASYPLDLMIGEQWWLNRIVSPNDVTPPPVTGSSPLIGLIEQGVDPAHPDLVEARLSGATSVGTELDSHGTAIAAIIGSPGEGAGIRGVWPGARMRHFPAGSNCSTATDAVVKAVQSGVSVLNMSYTVPASLCYSHYLATEYAVSRDVLPVAAAGNSGATGNAAMRPAVDPHVISVSAVNDKDQVASFATRNSGVDLTAPGENVFAPVIKSGAEGDIARSRYSWGGVSGTSFSAPMVTATAAWLRQVRPHLSARQVGRILTSSATELGLPGRDPDYGEGLLSIEAALAARRPYNDPREPNDDIPLVKGKGQIKKARYLWKPKGRRVVKLRATISRSKDPADVYRVRVPARKRILVTATQLEGDVRITALKPSTRSLSKTKRKVIVSSDRPYPKTEGIRVRNLRRKAKDIWIAVTPGTAGLGEHSAYRLVIRRN
ncbi:MAG: S8/S53 family peptidase [Actinomycetota bacterium]|nr:S8/S53 family peptidase [Actinomycetota bacterium]